MTIVNHELVHMLKDCSLALQSPTFMFDHQYKLTYYFPENFKRPPDPLIKQLEGFLEKSQKVPYTLQHFHDKFERNFLIYAIDTTKGEHVFIGIGPFLQQEFGRKDLYKLLLPFEKNIDKERWLGYYEQLPVWSPAQVAAVERILLLILPAKTDESSQMEVKRESYRKQSTQHTPPASSAPVADQLKEQFIESFKNGNDRMIEYYQSWKSTDTRSLSEDLIRSSKNKLIQMITELAQVSIEEGAQRDEIFLLSEFYISFLETKSNQEELDTLEVNIIQSFADRFKVPSHTTSYSPLVNRAQRYIFQNLSEELSLKDIAGELNVHPGYLSRIFAKEAGTSISHFINMQRVKEAKELLSITNYSLMEISTLLGYNSQSYFTRVFKQYEGTGPKEFRNKYQSTDE